MYIVIRNSTEGLPPSSCPAVYTDIDEARTEAIRRMLENGGEQVVFKALSAFEPQPYEKGAHEALK